MFMSLFVIYGFDTASTLAEETKDPRREAPRAVLFSMVGAFIIGAIFLWGTLMAIPDLKETVADAIPNFIGPQNIIEENLSLGLRHRLPAGGVGGHLHLLHVDHDLDRPAVRSAWPGTTSCRCRRPLAKVNPRLHTPMWACVAVAVLSAIPFLQFTGATIIAVAATAMIYLSYLLGNLAIMRARYARVAEGQGAVHAGRWAKPVNVLAILWGARCW